MKSISNIFFITLYFTFLPLLNAQVLNENINHPVYNFLERLAVKKIIDINQSVKPYTKKEIANWLLEIKDKKEQLNNLEKKELSWFLVEYDLERGKTYNKLGQFQFKNENFKFRVLPIAGYGISAIGKNNGFSKWIGAHFEGWYNNISLMFEYLDSGEFGDNVDIKKNLTSHTGHFIKGAPNGIEYSDVKGKIGYDFGYGSLSLKKEYVNIGSGKFGQLILSSKAASFPHIELKLKPVNWLEIYYMHGWLNSGVLDSNNFYYSYSSKIQPRLERSFISKYIALNYVSIKPFNWLNFSLGNSFIYSGKLRPEMFIPIMYFKVMDHNTGRGDVNDGNGLIFFDFNINYFKNINFYSTLLIDVLEIRPLLKGEFYKQWMGFTIGTKLIDLGIENFDTFIEYTRLSPWIYENKYTTTNYQHLGYVLGHWIGNNSDLLSFQIQYKFIRALALKIKTEFLRKGGQADNYYAYENRIGLPFLYGERRNDFRLNFSVNYNPLHNLFIKGEYDYSEISDELPDRTPEFLLGIKNSFNLSILYGLP